MKAKFLCLLATSLMLASCGGSSDSSSESSYTPKAKFPDTKIQKALERAGITDVTLPSYEASKYEFADYGETVMVSSLYETKASAEETLAKYIEELKKDTNWTVTNPSLLNVSYNATHSKYNYLNLDISNHLIYDTKQYDFNITIDMHKEGSEEVASFPTDDINSFLSTYGITGVNVPAYQANKYKTKLERKDNTLHVITPVDTEEDGKAIADAYALVLADATGWNFVEDVYVDYGFLFANTYYESVNITMDVNKKLFRYEANLSITVDAEGLAKDFPKAEVEKYAADIGFTGITVPSFPADMYRFSAREGMGSKYGYLQGYYDNATLDDIKKIESDLAQAYRDLGYTVDDSKTVQEAVLVTLPDSRLSISFYIQENLRQFKFFIEDSGPIYYEGVETYEEAVAGQTSTISFATEIKSITHQADKEIWNNKAFSFEIYQDESDKVPGGDIEAPLFFNPLYLYEKQEVTVRSDLPFSKIEFSTPSSVIVNYAKRLSTSFGSGTVTINKPNVSIEFDTPLIEYSFLVNKNTRMLDVKVTFAE